MRVSAEYLPKKPTPSRPLVLFEFPDIAGRNSPPKAKARADRRQKESSPAKSVAKQSYEKKLKFRGFVFESYQKRVKNGLGREQGKEQRQVKDRSKHFVDEMRESKMSLLMGVIGTRRGSKVQGLRNLLAYNQGKLNYHANKAEHNIERNMIEEKKELKLPALPPRLRQLDEAELSPDFREKLPLVDIERIFFTEEIINQMVSKLEGQ
jgi:hypothetical protein